MVVHGCVFTCLLLVFIHVHCASCMRLQVVCVTCSWRFMHSFVHAGSVSCFRYGHGGSCMVVFHIHGGSCMGFSMFMVVHAWCFPCLWWFMHGVFHVHGGSCMGFLMFMVVHACCFPCSWWFMHVVFHVHGDPCVVPCSWWFAFRHVHGGCFA